jgi:REP element-mobilizing transposase RayT
MTLFQNKYRIETNRLQDYDYSQPGAYFITIVTKNRDCLFGKIINGKLHLNPKGKIVYEEWIKSFVIRKELECDEFVIMPNHIHAIVIINNENNIKSGNYDNIVETHGRASLHHRASPHYRRMVRLPTSLSSFVAGFKSSVTKRINEFRNTPKWAVWQSRFYDHIIRNESELNKTREYIINNPLNWERDENYTT